MKSFTNFMGGGGGLLVPLTVEKDPIFKAGILTFIPKGRTSEKTEGKRRRRCHIARVILLVKAKLTVTTLLLLLMTFYDSKSVPTCHGFRRYISEWLKNDFSV